jgi:hypothetical protein
MDGNYTPTTLGVQSCRECTSGGTRTKEKVEYYWSSHYTDWLLYPYRWKLGISPVNLLPVAQQCCTSGTIDSLVVLMQLGHIPVLLSQEGVRWHVLYGKGAAMDD